MKLKILRQKSNLKKLAHRTVCQIVKKFEVNSVKLHTVAFETIEERIWFLNVYKTPNCTNEANFLLVEK